VLTVGFDATALNKLNDTCRRTGDKAARVFLAKFADIEGVKAVNVLRRIYAVECLSFVNVLGKGSLY
jgi:hypothetical protein